LRGIHDCRLRARQIEIRLDSEVVVYQMIGKFAVRSAALKPLHRQACALARHFSHVSYVHIPRDQNLIADALAGEAVAGRRWHSQGVK
jgi:ribonuclease HI